MIKYPLASAALVAAGALCGHTGPTGRVASPHLCPPQSSMGFSSAPRDTAQLLWWGLEAQIMARYGKGWKREEKIPAGPFSPVCSPQAPEAWRGPGWGVCAEGGAATLSCRAGPCSWGQPPALPWLYPAAVQAELAPGLLSTMDGVGATRCLCPAGSAGTSRFGINFRVFFSFFPCRFISGVF